ncbi:MAG: hypothetical protein DRQ49_18160 [Gammaproteobacteria bacterium]|nr:MAG: hypothetical protein DRQ49_18160 [Gammaproteobacteria bacterium]
MADKYLSWVGASKKIKEIIATVISTGVAQAGKIIALDANGKIDNSLLPTGVGAETKDLATTENLVAGEYVNIFDDSGTEKARKADASNGRLALGFVLAGTTSPAMAKVYLEGINNALTGLTPGGKQFLSADTPGAGVETPDATSGEDIQMLGKAISATEMTFEPAQEIELA